MPDRFAYGVFLSRNSKDKPQVRVLAEGLRRAGLQCGSMGGSFGRATTSTGSWSAGLEAARAQVLRLSPAALGADWVTLERSTGMFRDPAARQGIGAR